MAMKFAPILLIALASTSCLAAPAAPAADAAAQKNVVFIMLDDLDLSVWNTTLALGYMPRVQADLIAKGTTFNNMFVTESLCCASRTTYLTGQYPHNHGIYRNTGTHGGFNSFGHDQSTIATWMQKAGYRTGLLGKYLNGYDGPDIAYVPPGWETWNAVIGHLEFDYDMSVNGVKRHYGGTPEDYQVDVLDGLAVQFIESTDPRPFFLTITPVVPHYEDLEADQYDAGDYVRPAPRYADTPLLPTIPPESLESFNEADMGDKPLWMQSRHTLAVPNLRAGYNSKIAAIRAVDDLVGHVVDALVRQHKLGQTAIIFTSDNGYQYATHRMNGKISLYEESIRVPFILHNPGQAKSYVSNEWIANIDWAPTILDFGGASADVAVDGRSLRDSASGEPGRRTILVEYPIDPVGNSPAFAAVRSKDPRISGVVGDTLVYAETYDATGLVTDKEFYDLNVDPLQLTSLHNSTDPQRIKQMSALATRLHALKTCSGQTCRDLDK
jgi:arylsulfatase A-like enzyme